MRNISWPAVFAVIFMALAIAVVHLAQWERYASAGIVFGLCAVTCGLLSLRDR